MRMKKQCFLHGFLNFYNAYMSFPCLFVSSPATVYVFLNSTSPPPFPLYTIIFQSINPCFEMTFDQNKINTPILISKAYSSNFKLLSMGLNLCEI